MAEKEYAKGICFCGVEVPKLANWINTFKCQTPGCGAKYWAEVEDDLKMVNDEAEEMFNLPLDHIEIKIVHNYDEAMDKPGDKNGDEICLVFARPKPAEADA